MKRMNDMSKNKAVGPIKRSSIDHIPRVQSRFLGVVGHAGTGKWLAWKNTSPRGYLGAFDTEEQAAIAFDLACIRERGSQAITNFDLKCYNIRKFKPIVLPPAPLRMQTDTGFGNIKTPIAVNPNQFHLLPRHNAKAWTLEIAIKDFQARKSGSKFRHEAWSPFRPYKVTKCSAAQTQASSALPVTHDNSKAKQTMAGRESNGELSNALAHPHQIDYVEEEDLRAQALGFKHANSSPFMPYRRVRESQAKMYPEL